MLRWILCRMWTEYSREWNGNANARKRLPPEMFQLLYVQYAVIPRWPIWGSEWQYHLWKWLLKSKCQRSSEWKFAESQISRHHTINVNRMWRQIDNLCHFSIYVKCAFIYIKTLKKEEERNLLWCTFKNGLYFRKRCPKKMILFWH